MPGVETSCSMLLVVAITPSADGSGEEGNSIGMVLEMLSARKGLLVGNNIARSHLKGSLLSPKLYLLGVSGSSVDTTCQEANMQSVHLLSYEMIVRQW